MCSVPGLRQGNIGQLTADDSDYCHRSFGGGCRLVYTTNIVLCTRQMIRQDRAAIYNGPFVCAVFLQHSSR